jgi:hypothetical protein
MQQLYFIKTRPSKLSCQYYRYMFSGKLKLYSYIEGFQNEALDESEWLLFNANSAIFSAISWREQVNFQWDADEVRFVLDQHS